MASKGSPWFLRYMVAVAGWLGCAFMALALMVSLESRPQVWQSVFNWVIAILFANIGVFLFISSRFSDRLGRHAIAVLLACLLEAFVFAFIYHF